LPLDHLPLVHLDDVLEYPERHEWVRLRLVLDQNVDLIVRFCSGSFSGMEGVRNLEG
jgi:hypothetical protein